MGRDEANEPLLTVSVDSQAEPQRGADDAEPDDALSLQRLLYHNPREAIKWLEGEGVKKLGTFRVQASLRLSTL